MRMALLFGFPAGGSAGGHERKDEIYVSGWPGQRYNELYHPSLTVSANFPDRDPEFMRVYEIGFWQFPEFDEFDVFEARKPLILLAQFDFPNCQSSVIKDIARRKVKDRREMTYLVFDRNAQIQFL